MHRFRIGLKSGNELVDIVSDLHRAECYLRMVPDEESEYHFNIQRVYKGSVKQFTNSYLITEMTEVLKRAYIHFHKTLTTEIRNYKLAESIELPPETYFLTPSDIEYYPLGFQVFVLGVKGEWFNVLQNINKPCNASEIDDAAFLGCAEGWRERYARKARAKAKRQLAKMLNVDSA